MEVTVQIHASAALLQEKLLMPGGYNAGWAPARVSYHAELSQRVNTDN
jgi:hypothetical protein